MARREIHDRAEELLKEFEAEADDDAAVISGTEYGLMWDDWMEAAMDGDLVWMAKFYAAIKARMLVEDDRENLVEHPIAYVPIPTDRIESYDEHTFVQLSKFSASELSSITFDPAQTVLEQNPPLGEAEQLNNAVTGLWEYLWEKHKDDWYGE